MLRRIAALIAERRVEIAGVVSAETGKVRMEAVPEVQEGIDLIETYCTGIERTTATARRSAGSPSTRTTSPSCSPTASSR